MYKNQRESINNKELDWMLATVIYHNLKGTIDDYPRYSYVEKLSEETTDPVEIISKSKGVMITKDLKILIKTPIDNNEVSYRTDIISENGYNAYNCIKKEDNKTDTFIKIDEEKEPLFEKEKINKMVKYIEKYHKIQKDRERYRRYR